MNNNVSSPETLTGRKPLDIAVTSRRFIRAVFLSMVAIELLLVFLDATVNYARWTEIGSIRRLFNLTRDDGLGNWFASTQTLFVGLTFWLIFIRTRKDSARQAWGWGSIAGFFTYLAIDDGAKIHERIGTAVKTMGWAEFYPSYSWQVVLGPFLGAIGILILIFMWRELRTPPLRRLLVLGMSCYILSVGLDFAEGLPVGQDGTDALGFRNLPHVRHFTKVLEEFLEMLGTTLFLICALRHFTRISSSLSIRFD